MYVCVYIYIYMYTHMLYIVIISCYYYHIKCIYTMHKDDMIQHNI